jgi:hypothetical protein
MCSLKYTDLWNTFHLSLRMCAMGENNQADRMKRHLYVTQHEQSSCGVQQRSVLTPDVVASLERTNWPPGSKLMTSTPLHLGL